MGYCGGCCKKCSITTFFGCDACTCGGPGGCGCKFCWINCGYVPIAAPTKVALATMSVFFLAAAHSVESNELYQILLVLAFATALITAVLLVRGRKNASAVLGDAVSLNTPLVDDVEDVLPAECPKLAMPPPQNTPA